MKLTERPRRLRMNSLLRESIAETIVKREMLVFPVFVVKGSGIRREIPSMPGIFQFSPDVLMQEMQAWVDLGITRFLLFGAGEEKTMHAQRASSPDSIVNIALQKIKNTYGTKVFVITDVCLCAYTSHGHCGMADGERIVNDTSVELLAQMALSHAKAGADMVAPSDMMDGRIGKIRETLDGEGFSDLPIMSYSVKYASGYYGPFRDAADSAPGFGDRRTYQMDPRNGREALREALLDEKEGADILMVKPALAYLDVLSQLRKVTNLPVACYNVSAEYSMVKAGAMKGWIDEARIVNENFTAFARAGADIIISYHSLEAVKNDWL
ncbi:MAG: porphobilinogen synthase [Bacteroidota bacterium]|jgi:porphobilinogen synthase